MDLDGRLRATLTYTTLLHEFGHGVLNYEFKNSEMKND
jgi:hypothetical protein